MYLVQLDEMVFDVALWNAYQHYIACDAAVIPPVKGHGRDGIRGAGIVDFHHQEVVLLLYLICDFHLEGSESAFMTGYFLPVQIILRQIVLLAQGASADGSAVDFGVGGTPPEHHLLA